MIGRGTSVGAGLALALALAGSAAAEPSLTRMFTGPDGLSHLEPAPMPAGLFKTAGVQFLRAKAGVAAAPGTLDWHAEPRRRYVVTLSGRAIIETSGGDRFTADPEHVLLAEDLTGKGHRYLARPDGPQDWVLMLVEEPILAN